MSRTYKYSLSAEDFDFAVEKLKQENSRVQLQSISIARRVMVDDVPVQAVAAEAGITRQRVHATVTMIFDAYAQTSMPKPANWVRVAVSVPPDVATKIKSLERDELAKLAQEN